MTKHPFLLALLSMIVSPFLFAQNATTSLRGVVEDATGAAIAGASVVLDNPSTGFHVEAHADRRGAYSFQQLAPGTYTLTATASGFGVSQVEATLLVAQPATLNPTLAAHGNDTSIEVAGEALVNTVDATLGSAIGNQTIMALPSEARQPETLLSLQPGVLYLGNTSNNDSRSGAVSGARADQTNITLDGLDNNDQVQPTPFEGVLRTPLDALEEFRVTTSNANADTGRSSGGQVNLVTKSGTNQLHGSLYEYNRSSIGVANDWFNKHGELSEGLPNRPGGLIRNTYGISLGGPILKSKLFLFGNYEGDRIDESETVSRAVPLDSFRSGTLSYENAAGGVTTLGSSQIAAMDPNCTTNGTCPLGPGVNPAVLSVFAIYPHANGTLLGDGLNIGSYTFASPAPTRNNVYVSRLDWNASSRHQLYVRGSFQNDEHANSELYPGQPANSVTSNDSKGLSANYTWTATAHFVNNARYAFVRQSYASKGAGQGAYVYFDGITNPETNSRTSSAVVPLHNVIDDLTWTHGGHTLQAGLNFRHYTYNSSTDGNSYPDAQVNPLYLGTGQIAGQGGSFDPAAFGFAAVNGSFDYSYDAAVSDLAGILGEEDAFYNYHLSGSTATLYPVGAQVPLSFRSNELEYYVQDQWKPATNLTVTLGLRHTIQQTPYEIHGQQVQPTFSLNDWFYTRAQQAALGKTVQPTISFAPSGQARGGKPLYPMNWGDFAPRFAVAWSPSTAQGSWLNKVFGAAGKSSLRAGFGIYYDHYGQGLVANYIRNGAFGLTSEVSNPASALSVDQAPRYAGLHAVDTSLVPAPPASINYPLTPSSDPTTSGFQIAFGLDDKIKTPYSEAFNLSFQRAVAGFLFEAAYVGRLGRHLLQVRDLAQPLDLVDPKSGMDYYTAATLLSRDVDNGAVAGTPVAAVPYFEDLFPDAAAGGATATQSIFDNQWSNDRGNEIEALYNLDIYCNPGCGGQTNRFFDAQYASLYATSSIGVSSYNAGQFVVRYPSKHGVQFDLSYTISKSMDEGSDSERNSTSFGYGFLLDAFHPRKNFAVSDFDTRHLLTTDWILHLPAGHNQRFFATASAWVDALVGGWDLSGIARMASGLPFSLSQPGYSTNWDETAYMVQTGPIATRTHVAGDGTPQVFADSSQVVLGTTVRYPFPGEAGERNKFRGDGYFDVDAGLHKTLALSDRLKVQLAWEVFNVTNSVRFDTHSLSSVFGSGNLGVYGAQLTQARRMQISGRIQF